MTSKWKGRFSGFASGARPDDITLVPYPFHSEPQILETACTSGATYPQAKLVRHNPESATNLSRGHTTRRERNVNLRVVREGMFRARQFETRTTDHDH